MPPAFGEENTQSGIWASFRESWSPRLDINVNGAWYSEDSTLEPEQGGMNGNVVLELSKDLGRGLKLHIDPKLNIDEYAKGVQLFLEDHEDRPLFTLKEAFLSWYGETVEIEAGK